MIDFRDDPIQALPVVFAVSLIYWFVRRAYQKKKYGSAFKELRKKARLNEIIRLLLVAWAVECVCCTLFPSGFFYRVLTHFEGIKFFRSSPRWNFIPNFLTISDTINQIQSEEIQQGMLLTFVFGYIVNILMFVPLGYALPFIWKQANLIKVVLIGLISTIFIEFIQGFMYRDSTIDDIICNTLGALFGYLLYLLTKKLFPLFVAKASTCNKNK